MNLKSLSRRDSSTTGTIIGIAVAGIALLGNSFLGWRWSEFPNQPVPLAIGVITAIAAAVIAFQRFKN